MSKLVKNEVATTNKNALVKTSKNEVVTTANATKTNEILPLAKMTELMQKSVVNTKCKVFTDSTNYCGIGTKCNGFSVNVKKTKYNIYCNDSNFELLTKSKLDNVEYIKNGNATDKTRPNYITTNLTENVIKMFNTILNTYKIATDNN